MKEMIESIEIEKYERMDKTVACTAKYKPGYKMFQK
jgi:hypothetical protein